LGATLVANPVMVIVVWAQALICVLSLLMIAYLALKRGVKRHFLFYSYELVLASVFVCYILGYRLEPTDSFVFRLYWVSLYCLFNFSLAPLFLEGRSIVGVLQHPSEQTELQVPKQFRAARSALIYWGGNAALSGAFCALGQFGLSIVFSDPGPFPSTQ
jgi:hypothetical protein